MRRTRATIGLVLLFGALWAGAILVTATYYVPNAAITYTAKLSATRLAALLPSVGWREILATLGIHDLGFFVSLTITVVSVMAGSESNPRSVVLALASPVVLLFPVHAFGLIAIASDVLFLQPYDGEFLAEGWPQVYVFGLWTLGAGLTALQWRPHVPTAPLRRQGEA